jgi:serine phosphatase RsbU (regulator of sigma subunit)
MTDDGTTTADPAARRRRERSDAALNRARILEVAGEALAEDPDVGMTAIAERAGVSRGTVYRHYASREELVDAVRKQARDDAEAVEDDALRPAGQLANTTPTPLSVTDVLNQVPPFQLGEQIIAEAQRIPGVASAAIYLIDLDGTSMQRLAGAATFPDTFAVPLAVGPEIPRDGIEPLRERIEEALPGTAVAPLYLRGRAIGVLLAIGPADDAIRDLAREAAVALALAADYTDVIESTQRLHHVSAAAETQQILLPPRIVRITGATLAGNVLPGYEIGGDWFDYAENHDGTWIGIADVVGTGNYAAGVAAVLLGAFRSSRHRDGDPVKAMRFMHEVLADLPGDDLTATATIGVWNAPASRFRWVTCGEVDPMLIDADGGMEVLTDDLPRLGDPDMPEEFAVHERRLLPGERLLLLSDGLLGRRTHDGERIGVAGVHEAALKAPQSSAAGTLRAIEDAVREEVVDPLGDDATLVVLAPNPTEAD